MKTLIRGEKVKLSDYISTRSLEVEVTINAPFEIDFTCFGLDAERKISDDRYMVFYNQLSSPNLEIQLQQHSNKSIFKIDLETLPSTLPYLVFTATINGSQSMSQIFSGSFLVKENGLSILEYAFAPNDFKKERAIIIGEIYYKSMWRIGSIGQGFDGGLGALLTSFGGEIADKPTTPVGQTPIPTPPPTQTPPIPPLKQAAMQIPKPAPAPLINEKKVLLEKKMKQEAPHLIDLSKKAQISLEKVGLQQHVAKVALCLDISGSMTNLYKTGKIQHFVERILALATRFDDDGAIDLFLFGRKAYDAGELTISNNRDYIKKLLKKYRLEGSTYYSKVITMIRKHYLGTSSHRKNPMPQDSPVYVMFVTDGDTFDPDQTTKQIVNASYEPIFWQFMAINESKKGLFSKSRSSEFKYLEHLDTLEGRYIDNAGFFSIKDPAAIPDDELYDLLMGEYPQWVKEAKAKGLL